MGYDGSFVPVKMSRSVQFTALDALRGSAAIAVVFFHFFIDWAGYLAVDFFFVLSGFILSHGYLYGERRVGWRSFLVHRFARLYPLHVYALLVYVALVYVIERHWPVYPDGTAFTFVQHLLLLNNVGLNPHGLTFNEPSWSISTEMVVNLLFFALVTTGTASWAMALVALAGLSLIGVETGHLDVHYQNYFSWLNAGLVRCASSFLLGVLTYRLYLSMRARTPGSGVTWSLMEWGSLAVVVAFVVCRAAKNSPLDLAMPFVFVAVVLVFALERGWVSSQLGRLAYFGKISYSLYLNQFAILYLVRHVLHDRGVPLTLTVYLALVWAYSHFTFKWVEQPARFALRARLEPSAGRQGIN